MKNESVYTLNWTHTNGYMSVALYYGGTSNTVGTTFFTNTFCVPPGSGSDAVMTDWTNYVFAVISNSVPSAAWGTNLGIVIWQSTTNYNPAADTAQSWLRFDAVSVIPTNAVTPIANLPTISPVTTSYGNNVITNTEVAFGTPTLVYQWQTDGGSGTLTNVGGASVISGANSAVLVTLVPTNGGSQAMTVQYCCIVTNNLGSATSLVVTVTVLPVLPPTVTLDTTPGTNIYCFGGGNVDLQGAFSGALPMTNMWQRRISISGFLNLGVTASNVLTLASNDLNAYYTVTNVTSGMNGYGFRLTGQNVCGSCTNAPSWLRYLPDPPPPTTSPYANCVYTNNPVGYWRFWENNLTFWPTNTQAYDYSGNNLDGMYGFSTNGNPAAYDGFENDQWNQVEGPDRPGRILIINPITQALIKQTCVWDLETV